MRPEPRGGAALGAAHLGPVHQASTLLLAPDARCPVLHTSLGQFDDPAAETMRPEPRGGAALGAAHQGPVHQASTLLLAPDARCPVLHTSLGQFDDPAAE